MLLNNKCSLFGYLYLYFLLITFLGQEKRIKKIMELELSICKDKKNNTVLKS